MTKFEAEQNKSHYFVNQMTLTNISHKCQHCQVKYILFGRRKLMSHQIKCIHLQSYT